MNYSNYTLFEIIKYKIEFLECLEYTLISDTTKNFEIKNHLTYLNNEFSNGNYHKIVSSLFTSYNILNKPIIYFLKTYKPKKINRIINKNKLEPIINYNENLIDCYTCFNNIITSIISEKEISKILSKKIIKLNEINKQHFLNFLFFNSYNLYLNCFYNKEKLLRYSNKDMERLVSIINYCNLEKNFNNSINVLKEEDETKIYQELEKISNDCIQLEKKQYDCLNEIITTINNEVEKSKNKDL